MARKLISQEEAARNYLKENAGLQIADKANRALGILTHAKVISSQEALSLISDLRLGKTLGMIEGYSLKLINELLLLCQPSYLQVLAKKEMGPENRDLKRAEMIKRKIKTINLNGGVIINVCQIYGKSSKVLYYAQEEAKSMNYPAVGTEHLLLGLLREGEGVGAKALMALGIDLEKVKETVKKLINIGNEPVTGEIGFTPRAKKVLGLRSR